MRRATERVRYATPMPNTRGTLTGGEPRRMDHQDTPILSRRQAEIVALLRESGRVAVEELATRFAVTPQTIRRDLNELSDARLISRVHGGAIVASGVANMAYEARKLVAGPNKRLIGEAAARLIPDSSSLFINIGTTTEEVARALASRSDLLVITNNLNVAMQLYPNRAVDVIIAGGNVRSSDGGIMGASAVELIRQFRVDTAVIGTSAIDVDGTLLDFDIREVDVFARHHRERPPGDPGGRQQQVQPVGTGAYRNAGGYRRAGDRPSAGRGGGRVVPQPRRDGGPDRRPDRAAAGALMTNLAATQHAPHIARGVRGCRMRG